MVSIRLSAREHATSAVTKTATERPPFRSIKCAFGAAACACDHLMVVFTLSAATATRELSGSATSTNIFTTASLTFEASAISESNCDLAKRSEEHTSELQSLKRISYAVFCMKKKNNVFC